MNSGVAFYLIAHRIYPSLIYCLWTIPICFPLCHLNSVLCLTSKLHSVARTKDMHVKDSTFCTCAYAPHNAYIVFKNL